MFNVINNATITPTCET